jgi:hypothetical protein
MRNHFVTQWLKEKKPLATILIKHNWMVGVMQEYAEWYHNKMTQKK